MEKLFVQASSNTQGINEMMRVLMDAGFTILGFGVEYVEQAQPTSNVSPAQEVPDETVAAEKSDNNATPAPSLKVSPAAAKLAQESGFDISLVTEGSGKDGAVTKIDVQRAIKAHALPPTTGGKNTGPSEPEPNPNFKQVTRADVEQALMRIYQGSTSQQEGADRVRAILADFNAPNVTALYEEQYQPVYDRAMKELGVA